MVFVLIALATLALFFSSPVSADACVAGGSCYATVQQAIDNAPAAGTVVINDSATYTESLTISQAINITSNGSGLPTIHGDNQTTISSGNNHVILNRLNISMSGTASGTPMVDANNIEIHNSTLWIDSNASAGVYSRSNNLLLDHVNITSVNATNIIDIDTQPLVTTINNSRVEGEAQYGVRSPGVGVTVENSFFNITSGYALGFAPDYLLVRNSTIISGNDAITGEDHLYVFASTVESVNGVGIRVAAGINATILQTTISSPNNSSVEGPVSANFTIARVTADNILSVTGGPDNDTFAITVSNSSFAPSTTNLTSLNQAGDRGTITYQNPLSVTVIDESGAGVQGVAVTVTNSSSESVASATTDSAGEILFENVTYAVMFGNSTITSTAWQTNHTATLSSYRVWSASAARNMTAAQDVTLYTAYYPVYCFINASSTCASPYVKYLGLENETGGSSNAHAQNYTLDTYANSLCCQTKLSDTLANSCSDATLVALSSEDNAHLQNSSVGTYSVPACMSLGLTDMEIAYVNGTCDSGYACFFSMSSQDNAHAAACGQYDISVCGRPLASAPSTPVLLSPANESALASRTVAFEWTDSHDAQGHSIFYHLNLSAPAGCTGGGLHNVTDSNYTSGTLCTTETYNWSVQACDLTDGCSDWTSWWGFNIPLTISEVTLNASDSPENTTAANLTAHATSNAGVFIHDWRVAGESIAAINFAFDTNISTDAAGAVRDYSSNKNNATLSISAPAEIPTWTENGISGGAYVFDGGDGIEIGADLGLGNDNFTIAVWANITDSCSSNAHLVNVYGGTGNPVIDLGCSGASQGIEAYVRDGSSHSVDINGTTTINDGEWHFITLRRAGNNISVYLDGSYETSDVAAFADPFNFTAPWTIGTRADGSGAIQATIDEVAVYRRALSAEQISSLYNSGSYRTNRTVSQETVVGENWSVAVTANDGAQDSDTLQSNGVVIQSEPITPNVTSVILNATDHPLNYTTANLTAYASATDYNTIIHDWRVDDTSIAVLNMPMDSNTSDTTAGAVRDYSTYENNGTLGGGTSGYVPTWNASGVRGGAYTFDGVDDYISIADSPEISGGHSLSISLWLLSDRIGNGSQFKIISKSLSGSSKDYNLNIADTGEVYLYWENGEGNDGECRTPYALDNNTWHHVVATYNHSSFSCAIYVNGALNGTNTSSYGMPDTSVDLEIGRGNFYGQHFPGSIDEVLIYNRTLSSEQVAALYNSGSYRTNLTVSEETAVGENWSVAVTANDGTQDSDTLQSNTVTIVGSVCVNETGVCWGTIQEAVDNATAGQTVVITDDGSYEESLSVTKSLNLTSNGTGMPTIWQNNGTVITVSSGILLEISRVNITLHGNGTSVRAIQARRLILRDTALFMNHTGNLFYIWNDYLHILSSNITGAQGGRLINGEGGFDTLINNSRILGDVQTVKAYGWGPMTVENAFMNVTGQGLDDNNENPDLVTVRNTTIYTDSYNSLGFQNFLENVYFESSSGQALSIQSNSLVINATLVGGGTSDVGIYGANATNITFVDSTFDSFSSGWDNGWERNVTFINSTIEPSGVDTSLLEQTIAHFTFKKYLDVYVNDTAGNPLTGVNVTVEDNSSTEVASTLTDGTGRITTQNITYAYLYGNVSRTTEYYTNHTVMASLSGYASNTTSINMSSSRVVNLTLYSFNSCGQVSGDATLGDNVSASGTCFEIVADNVTLDCAGYTITGDGSGAGVYAANRTNVTVKNCAITNFDRGVWLYDTNDSLIQNNTLTSNHEGIDLIASDDNVITGVSSSLSGSSGPDSSIGVTSGSDRNTISHSSSSASGPYRALSISSDSSGTAIINTSFPVTSAAFTIDNANTSIDTNTTHVGSTFYYFSSESFDAANLCPASFGNVTAGFLWMDGCENMSVENVLFDTNAVYHLWLESVDGTNFTNITANSDPTYAYTIRLSWSDSNRFEDVDIGGFVYLIQSDGNIFSDLSAQEMWLVSGSGDTSVENFTFADNIFTPSGADKPHLFANGSINQESTPVTDGGAITNVTFINVSHNKSQWGAGSDALTYVWWYLDVNVTYANGTPVNAADITVEDTTGQTVLTASTDAQGRIGYRPVLSYEVNTTALTNSTPHTIIVNLSGYPNETVTSTLDGNMLVNVTLENDAPTMCTLLEPSDGNTTLFDRYTYFDWTDSTDPEGQAVHYEINISAPTGPGCSALPVRNVTPSDYTSADELCLDNSYNWSVRACDEENLCSDWTSTWNFTIASVLSINMSTNNTDFGSLSASTPDSNVSDDTLDDSPGPLVLDNIGNVDANIELVGLTALWTNAGFNTSYWQTAANGSAFLNVSDVNYTVLTGMAWNSSTDIDLNITVPVAEPSGTKNGGLQAIAAPAEP